MIYNIIVLLAFFMFSIEIIRRHAYISFFIVIFAAIQLTPIILQIQQTFVFTKTIISFFPLLIYLTYRIVYINQPQRLLKVSTITFLRRFIYWLFYVNFFINIIAACLVDGAEGAYFNMVSGLVLAFTIPMPSTGKWGTNRETDQHLLLQVGKFWIFLYTSWNMALVLNYYPQYFIHVACLLFAPILYSMYYKDEKIWFYARAISISISMLIRGLYDFITPEVPFQYTVGPTFCYNWGILNFILSIVLVIYIFKNNINLYFPNKTQKK